MSLGQVLFMGLIVAPVVTLGIAFFVLTALLVASFIADMVDEFCLMVDEFCLDDLLCAIFAILFSLFLAWFVLDCPGCEEQRVPHAVEGREEWIDLREGTTYSQVDRRTDD